MNLKIRWYFQLKRQSLEEKTKKNKEKLIFEYWGILGKFAHFCISRLISRRLRSFQGLAGYHQIGLGVVYPLV